MLRKRAVGGHGTRHTGQPQNSLGGEMYSVFYRSSCCTLSWFFLDLLDGGEN
jgi:hypothetical protein